MNGFFYLTCGLALYSVIMMATADIEQEGAPVPSIPAPVPTVETFGVLG